MERLLTRILPTAVAIAAGCIVLLGYLIPYPLLVFVRDQLLRWAAIVAGSAFILGFFNVLSVHTARVTGGEKGAFYSAVLIVAALVSLLVTLGGLLPTPARALSDWWFRYVLSPLQASTAGLIAFTLALAAFRLLRSRRSAGAIFFLLSAAIVLVGTLPLPEPVGDWMTGVREWWMAVLATAGMRGLLIGVGLGILLVGLRVITGLDRPHSEM
jgi:hypothetical protein